MFLPSGITQQQRNHAGGGGGGSSPGTTNLMAWWTLNESSGATRADSHSGGYDLLDYNTVGQSTGKVGNCADFDGINDQLYHGATADNHPFDNLSEFSFAFWMYADALGSNDILNVRDGVGLSNIAWSCQYYNSAIRLYVPDGSTDRHAAWGSPLSTAAWYFIYGYWKGADAEIGISVNDGTIVTSTGPSSMNTVGPAGNYIRLGSGPSVANAYNGRMDELGIFSSKLTSENISWLYNSGSGRTYSEL